MAEPEGRELRALLLQEQEDPEVTEMSKRDSADSEESKPLAGQTPPPKYGASSGSEDTSRSGSSSSSRASEEEGWRNLMPTKLQTLLGYIMFWKRGTGPSLPRTIYFLQPERNKESKFYSNRISTTKYNVLTFIPLFFFDQFRRYANLFFLFIAFLQQFPGISPTGRFTTIVPLSLVLLATAIKEIIEDIRRFMGDNQVNYAKVKVLCRPSEVEEWKWVTKRWTQVKVGDIVRVEDKSFFPADLLLLSSSEAQGIGFVETSNLDGETNLKIRQAHPATANLSDSNISDYANWRVECEGPNNRLYDFTGNIYKVTPEDSDTVFPLQPDQILLRGAQLRNTSHITGLVIYTGHDSKLLQNSTPAPLKRSRMEHVTNRQVLSMLVFLLFLAVFSSFCSAIWGVINSGHWYLYLVSNAKDRFVAFLKSILTFIILYNNLIPISLIVTLEIVKFVQAFFINWDCEMYHEGTDTPALARNSNLNEELGQVKYVFSDKTGTLTENIMAFKKCSVLGKVYRLGPASDTDGAECLDLQEALMPNKATAEVLQNFMLTLALCHTVIPESVGDHILYHASSPDEEALVKAAKEVGVVFKARLPEAVIIEVHGEEVKYEILNLLEFNSDRKRMSVIVRTPDGTIKLLCKGADTVIYERLIASDDPRLPEITGEHMEKFAIDGLRTLCVAERTIEETYYKSWDQKYKVASTALDNREQELDMVAEMIEKDLSLLGATAIEDKLQQGVPEAIADLKEAGMKVWILTGDKQETAINIGFACHQLAKNMKLLVVNCSKHGDVRGIIQDHLSNYQQNITGARKECNAALIIDGKSLSFALKEDTRNSFLELALICKSVICCRVSPLQKAKVVRLVQQKCKKDVTLAIGDGANDVGMIQAAHVGVGISGKEGLQATLASDYAIAQFRFLRKLLLVHGAWDYNRLAKIILFSFYKNICLYIIEFWFAMFSGFSGQAIFERWTIGLFNVLFTSLGTFTLGFFEQDVSAEVRMRKPGLYKASQEGKYFNSYVFWKWVLFSLYNSIVLFFGIYFMLSYETPFSNGEVSGVWYVGNTIYTSVVITVNLKLALESQFWPLVHHIAIWGSILVWFIFLGAYSHFWPTFPVADVMVGQDVKLYGSLAFYAIFILGPAIAMFPDVLKTVIQKVFYPTDLDKERLEDIRRRRKGIKYQKFMDSSLVTYSVQNAGKYADGLHLDDEQASSPLSFGRTLEHNRGYAFAQEDHGSTIKGTHVQRRTLIRMFNTLKGTSIKFNGTPL